VQRSIHAYKKGHRGWPLAARAIWNLSLLATKKYSKKSEAKVLTILYA
jgi:hypothetical protein